MKSAGQEPLAGIKLREWVVDAGMELIVSEETRHDCGM
jgi:hypothetical protein